MRQSTSPIALPLPMSPGRRTRFNKITGEAEPIRPALAPFDEALTFAQVRGASGRVVTLLVTAYTGDSVEAIDLTQIGAAPDLDIFEASAAVGEAGLQAALKATKLRATYAVSDLHPSGGMVERHVATGTNFAEHASETGSRNVFNFPKFGRPTPPETTMTVYAGTLMDYEVEISARFDRDIRSMADFEAARKGFFLCGDFTDRATLARLIDPKNFTSGRGFSDAKSGPDWFPTGPFLVIPNDWRAFVRRERIVTRVNGEVKQDARGEEMILDFEGLVAKALGKSSGNYTYRGRPVTLLKDNVIPRGAAIMSGTSEGVLFMAPMREDIIGGIVDHVLLGRFLRGRALFASIANRFIRTELKIGRYLKVGDRVEHLSSTMGALKVELIAP